MKQSGFTAFLTFFMSMSLFLGQKKFTQIQYKDSVIFSYRLKPSKQFKKDSTFATHIRIQNFNEYPVETSYVVDYYWDGIRKASSEQQNFCLKKKKAITGKIKQEKFELSGFKEEDIKSDRFILELSDVKVNEVENCKKR